MSRPSRFTVREQHGAEQIDTAQLKPETKPSKQKPMPRAFATALIVQSAPKKYIVPGCANLEITQPSTTLYESHCPRQEPKICKR